MTLMDAAPRTIVPHDFVTGYDIIGDVHGRADLLADLLKKLGYNCKDGYYRHPTRQAIFLGDLLDRGAQVFETVAIVRKMVERGAAYMVLGNHEYMMIAYCTAAPDYYPFDHLWPHSPRLEATLQKTLLAFPPDSEPAQDLVNWLRGLPLYLEFPHFRAVHACWDNDYVKVLDRINPRNNLRDDQFLYATAMPDKHEHTLLYRMLNGTFLKYPEGKNITTADGWQRNRFRTRFWCAEPKTYGDVVFQPGGIPEELLDRVLTEAEKSHLGFYAPSEKPLFVGHYWQSGLPVLLRSNIACLDYSAVVSGTLVAYRIECDDETLSESKFYST